MWHWYEERPVARAIPHVALAPSWQVELAALDADPQQGAVARRSRLADTVEKMEIAVLASD